MDPTSRTYSRMDAVVPPVRAGPASHNSRILLNAERPVVPAVRSHSKSLPALSRHSYRRIACRLAAIGGSRKTEYTVSGQHRTTLRFRQFSGFSNQHRLACRSVNVSRHP